MFVVFPDTESPDTEHRDLSTSGAPHGQGAGQLAFEATRRRLYVPCPAHLATAARLRATRGVFYQGGQLVFDRQIHDERSATLFVRHLRGEPLRAAFQGAGQAVEATAEDLRIINERHSARELTAADVVVFQDWAANDSLMRGPLRLTEAYLRAVAPSFVEGRTVLLHHHDDRPIGATFAADVVRHEVRGIEAHWLRVRWYAVTSGASEQRLQDIQDAQTGVLRYTSIEAIGGSWELVETEGPDGEPLVFWQVDDGPGAEAGELSRVYLGRVRGAGDNTFKAVPEGPGTAKEENDGETLCVW